MLESPTINTNTLLSNTYTGGVAELQERVSGITEGGLLPLPEQGRFATPVVTITTTEETGMTRLVRVIIIDPEESVPMKKRLLYDGGEQFTDATDQELFFETDISAVLKDHNEYRLTLPDKSINTERVVMLEETRIRDLVMSVVEIASF